jgi:diaminohydroxyphosphoribosylaminopyrimidine deaminase/5-amino-6-(5-phosphoribosylamino)uracil reductase
MLVREGFKRVVIGLRDSNPKVNGDGIRKLLDAGIEVSAGLLEAEGRELNRFFLSAFEKQRPWVMLKWAESSDGFAGTADGGPTPLTGELANRINHRWRGFYQAILVGTNTAAADNPSLGTRLAPGPDPLRIAVDLDSKLNHSLRIFDGSIPTLIVCRNRSPLPEHVEALEVTGPDWIPEMLSHLHSRGIHSLMVEGGPSLQRSFLELNLWDEIRRWKTPVELGGHGGSPVAEAPIAASSQEFIGADQLLTYYRKEF